MARQEVEVKIMISREIVKPSSPTPFNLKTFKLSFFDQLYPSNIYSSLLMFYPFLDHGDNYDQDRRVRDLKSTLSETLTRFYPLAGRIIENEPFIDCADEGVDFVKAKVSCRLSDILKRPDPALLSKLFAIEAVSVQDGRVLLVQANLFACGGIAVGVSISHRIADASTLGLFIKGWAAQARGAGDVVTPDVNVIACRFPATGVPVGTRSTIGDLSATRRGKTKRYVFDSKSINALKAKATSASVQRPSRVHVVAAHIWMSMMKLKSRSTTGKKSHVLVQPINLRKRIDPPLSDNSFGNLGGPLITQSQEGDENVGTLEDLVCEFSRGLINETEKLAKMNNGSEIIMGICERRAEMHALIAREDVEKCMVTSWCRFGFYENSDFGWGKPVWLGLYDSNLKDTVVLMDTRDGDAVEAWVTLSDHDMDLLETDQDFLEFASLDPIIDLH